MAVVSVEAACSTKTESALPSPSSVSAPVSPREDDERYTPAFRVWPPNTSNVPIGSSTTRDVFTDRIRVWFSDRLTMPEYVSRETSAAEAAFSFTLSKMTTVSYNEYPRMVRIAITDSGVTWRPTSA